MQTFLLLLFLLLSHRAISHPHRNLDSIIDNSGACYDVFLNSSSSNILGDIDKTNLASAYGIVFSITNTAYEFDGSGVDGGDIEISALSIYLDGTEGANFSVYVLDGKYFTEQEDGTIISMVGGALGGGGGVGMNDGDSIGWKQVTSGTIEDFSMNFEGMSVLILEEKIILPPNSVKSIYVKLSAVSLLVEEAFDDGKPLVPENVDSLAVVTEKFDPIQIRIGRGVLLRNWASGLPTEVFETFYPPRRFLGNLYVAVPACTVTIRNSYFNFYGIGETILSRSRDRIAPRLFPHHQKGSRLLQERSTSGCFEPDQIYPIIEDKLRELAEKRYSESLPESVEVTSANFLVKADDTIWSSKGDCNNIRIIFDEELVYSMKHSDEMTVEELAILPFSTLVNRKDLLLSLSESNAYFSRFGQVSDFFVTDTTLPTRMPSSKPSAMPSSSLFPSVEPSNIRSETPSLTESSYPSGSPTSYPSNRPSTTPSVGFFTQNPSLIPRNESIEGINDIITTIVEFKYDIWYAADRFHEGDIKGFIVANVTDAFRETLLRESPLLPLVISFNLELSDDDAPFVTVDPKATDVMCITDNLPGNANNICERFSLNLSFQHLSTMDSATARFWLLRVADRSAGNLQCNYSGLKSVKSDQVITFKDSSGLPTPEEEKVFCDVIAGLLNDTVSMENYIVTDVDCVSFEFIPYGSYRQRLRLFQLGLGGWRRLQAVSGDLNVYYNISSEYSFPVGQKDTMADGFGDLIEDSINRGTVGDAILKSLEDRQIEVVESARVVAREVETPSPTSSPTYEQVEPDSPPSYFENDGTVENGPTPNSRKTSAILAVMLSLIVFCSTFSIYLHYLRHLRLLAKDDYSYDTSEIPDNALFCDGDDDGFNDNRADWGPVSSTRSLAVSASGDEPDRIPHSHDNQLRRTSLDSSKDGDANTTSSTISDTNSREVMEDKLIGRGAMNRLRSFERHADLQKITQSDEFKEQLRERISKNHTKLNGSLASFDERIRKRPQSTCDGHAPFDTTDTLSRHQNMSSDSSFEDRLKSKLSIGDQIKLNDSLASFDERIKQKPQSIDNHVPFGSMHTSSVHQKMSSGSSFEDRLKAKLSIHYPQGNRIQGNDHKRTNSEGSFEDRLRSKLSQDVAHSGSGTDSQRLLSDNSRYGKTFSQYSFEDRLKAKFFGDDQKVPCGDWYQITKSVKSMDVQTFPKLDLSPDIPSNISFAQNRKSHSTNRSVDSFEKRTNKKPSSDGFKVSSDAMYQNRTSSDSCEERIRRKFEATSAVSHGLTYSNDEESSLKSSPVGGHIVLDDSFLNRIHRKLLKKDVEESPTSKHEMIASLDSADRQILRKLHQSNDNDTPIRSRDSFVFTNSASGSTFEERIYQKLAQERAEVFVGDSEQGMIASNSMSKGIRRNIHEPNQGTSSDTSIEKNAKMSAASRECLTFEERIQQKLARKLAHTSSTNRDMSETLGNVTDERLARELKSNNNDRSDVSAHRSKILSRDSSVDSFDARVKQKICQHPIQTVSANYHPQKSSDTIKRGMHHRYTGSNTKAPSDVKVRRMSSIEAKLALESRNSRKKDPSNLQSDTHELRLLRKLQESSSISSQHTADEMIESKISSDAVRFTFDAKMQKTLSTRESSQSQVVDSFEAKLRQKLRSHNAELGSSTTLDDSFKSRLARKLAQSWQTVEKHMSESSADNIPASATSNLGHAHQKISSKLDNRATDIQ